MELFQSSSLKMKGQKGKKPEEAKGKFTLRDPDRKQEEPTNGAGLGK